MSHRCSPRQEAIGFALETHDGEASARSKLERKRLDFIALNYANEAGSGFGTETNRVTILDRAGTTDALPLLPKREVADRILDRVARAVVARVAAAQTAPMEEGSR